VYKSDDGPKNGSKLVSFVINCVVHYRTPLGTCIDLSTMGMCHLKRVLLFKKIIDKVDKFGNFEKSVSNKCYLCWRNSCMHMVWLTVHSVFRHVDKIANMALSCLSVHPHVMAWLPLDRFS